MPENKNEILFRIAKKVFYEQYKHTYKTWDNLTPIARAEYIVLTEIILQTQKNDILAYYFQD